MEEVCVCVCVCVCVRLRKRSDCLWDFLEVRASVWPIRRLSTQMGHCTRACACVQFMCLWNFPNVCERTCVSPCLLTSCSGESCSMSVRRHRRPGRKWLIMTSSEMTAQEVKEGELVTFKMPVDPKHLAGPRIGGTSHYPDWQAGSGKSEIWLLILNFRKKAKPTCILSKKKLMVFSLFKTSGLFLHLFWVFSSVHAPSTNMEEAGFMTNTAAGHQMEFERLWGAVPSFIFIHGLCYTCINYMAWG